MCFESKDIVSFDFIREVLTSMLVTEYFGDKFRRHKGEMKTLFEMRWNRGEGGWGEFRIINTNVRVAKCVSCHQNILVTNIKISSPAE